MDLKIRDVAELLRVSETTIRRWLAEGKIPAYRIHHQYRFNREEIENWVMSCRLQKKEGDFMPIEEKQIYPRTQGSQDEEAKGNQQFSLFRSVHHGEVFTDIAGLEKDEIIRHVVERISTKLSVDADVLTNLLLQREAMMPTALSNGIAVPHTRDFLLRGGKDAVVIVFLENPIDWGALDGEPVHTLFFLFASDDKRHLHLLAKIAHLSSCDAAHDLFKERPNKSATLDYLKSWEPSVT
ncbi:MAG: PTS sugar transporter subunit IIA [Simkaniaceae bacterium]|nr:PTS sugar transporter subunit IIA [Simkaniaceae bacterium]